MTVPHSIQATDAVLITNANTPIINTYQTGPLARFTFSSGSADNPGGKVTTKTLSYLYEYDHWIRENTKKDILALTLAPYVYGGMTLPTTDEATRQATVKAELEATVPKVLAECNELLKGGAITFNANTVLDQVEANAITPA